MVGDAVRRHLDAVHCIYGRDCTDSIFGVRANCTISCPAQLKEGTEDGSQNQIVNEVVKGLYCPPRVVQAFVP